MPLEETRIVRASLAVIAIHVADDRFLQPQPGTSALDHLVSGLVPIGVLALAALAYPRGRAGVRGSIALALGVFGVATGTEGIYGIANGALAGDDFTSLASLVAGLVLVATGATVLWRSRRGGSPRRRYLRRMGRGLGGLLVAYLLVYPVSFAYVATHVSHPEVATADLGAPYEEVSFTTSDGLELAGWYVPSRNGSAVVAFPGRRGPQPHARMLVEHGYGVLLLDRRGEGASEGDPNLLGWGGHRDLEAAADFLAARADVDDARIGGLGLSVGGELLIEAAAGSDGLRAVVSEGAGIRSLAETLDIPALGPRIQLTLLFGVVTPAVAVFSDTLPPPSLTDLVGEISPRPLFIIHADPGQGGEVELSKTYYQEADEPKEVWRVPGAGHTGGIDAAPEEYERRVVSFFDEALLGRGS